VESTDLDPVPATSSSTRASWLEPSRRVVADCRIDPTSDPDEIFARSEELFRAAEQSKELPASTGTKIEQLQQYEVLAVDRLVAILSWGRSGSLLLASYLDGHEDVILLPELCGWGLYEFFDRYQSLGLRAKLLAYPAFKPDNTRFFEGPFRVSPDQYYAAVEAIVSESSQWPVEFVESRRAFVLFVHIAYTLALGRKVAGKRPLIVHALHEWSDRWARCVIEDFPGAKFIHAVRDPISTCDGTFHYLFASQMAQFPRTYFRAPYSALSSLIQRDRAHFGMRARSRAIRFEDLHTDIAGTMFECAAWLGIPYRATLTESTFNGIPYIVKREGVNWSGPRLEQAKRRFRNLSVVDRALLFGMFQQNLEEWRYPYPKIFRCWVVRFLMVLSAILVPTKMEIVAAAALVKRGILPAVRRGAFASAIRVAAGIAYCRLQIIYLLTPAFFKQCARHTALLRVLEKSDVPPASSARLDSPESVGVSR
jgi:hypothetical protein